MIEGIQKPLFEIKPFSGINRAIAFGATRTGLDKGGFEVLKNIFYGMRNLKISLEMLSIQNAAEILEDYFTAGDLKRGNNFNLILYNPPDFFRLIDYINDYSNKNRGFANLTQGFKECFDIEQKIRLGILNQKIKEKFVDSFLSPYRPSNREDPGGFYDPNCDGRDRGIYAKWIYKELESLSERVKEIDRIIL